MSDAALMTLVRTIVAADDTVAFRLLTASPALAKAHFEIGATRRTPKTYYIDEIGHYIYAGDTALHVAAAAHRPEIVQKLIAKGASVRARIAVVPSPFTTRSMASRAHGIGTHLHKR